MSGTTSLGLPYPELTDDPNGAAQIQALATAVDALLTAPRWPVGDSSNSIVLSGSDVSSTAGQNKTIVSSTFTLGHTQWVTLAGRANFTNTGGNISLVGIYIDVDSVVVPALTSGNVNVGTASPTDRRQLSIPAFTVSLAAGSHTVRLRMDRADNNATTIIARAADTGNITSAPCSLTVIV